MAYPYYNSYQQNYNPYQPSIIWVNGEQEAAAYPVAPNNAVALWDSAAPAIYLKKADAAGKPTMQAFDLVERVTKKDDGDIAKKIAEIQAEIATLKKDFYGKESAKDE